MGFAVHGSVFPVLCRYIDSICPPTATWPTPSFGEADELPLVDLKARLQVLGFQGFRVRFQGRLGFSGCLRL